MDLLPMFFGEQVLENGIFLPAGEGKAAYTLRNDMAEATANILKDKGHENKMYDFSNSENVSVKELANTLSSLTGRSINYVNPTNEVYVEALTNAGVPADYVGVFSGFAEAIKQGELQNNNGDLENLLGRKPTTTKAFLTSVYSKN